ncbi:hypothetical protein [Desulfosporosinus sp. OT]|uniref:hypothetical protein n=1 Tax=Desulfosporosinus sp. OT TaxID=913865 RepID=UPI0002239C1D|nr:hypothetical protein [Desulfosporosinus sp. OT]EGW36042.1 hypothetical protein DOT_6099 [Desulfosporosinus sp. OT]
MSYFQYRSTVLPGQRTNLVAGLQPDVNTLFFSSIANGTGDPVEAILAQAKQEEAIFGPFPELTPCKNWTALISAFFAPYAIQARPDTFGGAAAVQRYSSQNIEINKSLASLFGIKPKHARDDANIGFVLARVSRNLNGAMATLTCPSARDFYSQLCNDFKKQVGTLTEKLKTQNSFNDMGGLVLAPTSVDPILNFISRDFGSHFVQSVSIGDLAYQVFVYDLDKFDLICQSLKQEDWSGVSSLGFRYWTSDNYLKYQTPVRLLSRNPDFDVFAQFLKDDTYGLDQSIFSLVLNPKANNEAMRLTDLTCTGAQLIPITALHGQAPHRTLYTLSLGDDIKDSIMPMLNNVAVQSFVCRFGGEAAGPAAFPNHNTIDYATIYEVFSRPDTVSLLWSPYLSITQMYVRLDEIWKQQAMNKSGVKQLVIVADVIEVGADIDLSDVQNVTLVCRLFIAQATEKGTPTIKLSEKTWSPLQFYCGSMIGTCIFQEAEVSNERRVVFDTYAVSLSPDKKAVSYEDFFAGKFPSPLLSHSTHDMDSEWRSSVIQTGLETLLMSASVPLTPQMQLASELQQTAVEAWNCLTWILNYSSQTVESLRDTQAIPPELMQVYANALALSRTVADPSKVTGPRIPCVPPLRYTAFEDAVNKLLDAAKDYKEQIDEVNQAIREKNAEIQRTYQESTLNDNIREVAKFLLDQNNAMVDKEKDLVNYHNQIIGKKQDMIVQLDQRSQQIHDQLQTLKTKLDEAKDELTKAIEVKKAEETTKAVFEFVLGLTEVLGGIWFGVASLKHLPNDQVEKTLKKLEAFLKIVESVNKLKDTIEEGVKEALDAADLAKVTPPGGLESQAPSETDWDLFMNGAEAAVKPAEEFVAGEVANYVAAVRNMTAVGKSLIPILQQKAQLEFDLFAERSESQVNQRQAARLLALQTKLNIKNLAPGIDYVADLGSFNAILQQRQNTVLLTLTRMVALQDASMTYHYLSQPTVITHFDISSVRQSLAVQAVNAVRALQLYPYPPTDLQEPVQYIIQHVTSAELLSDLGVAVEIPMNQSDFDTLARVRINSVDVRVEGVKTKTGKCHVLMESTGDPMHDRGLHREVLTYETGSRKWDIVYDISSDKTIIGTRPAKDWGQYFTKLTPFQTWRISVPATSENEGIEFNSRITKVTLKFMLEAVYSSTPAMREIAPPHNVLGLVANDSTSVPLPPTFISNLNGHSITDGWDVLTFASIDRINDLWKERWEIETKEAFQGDRTFVQEIKIAYTQDLPGSIQVVYDLDVIAGPPSLKFLADSSQQALVNIPLTEGNLVITTWLKGQQVGQEIKKIQSTAENPVLVRTKAPLQQLQGEVDSNTVFIDPLQGIFEFENITFDPAIDTNMSDQLAAYFKRQKLQPWKIGTVRIPADKEFLQPKVFDFRTYIPPEERKNDWPAVLCLYILTITKKPPEHGMRQSWPDMTWPISNDYDAAVYFSADLLWNKVIYPAVDAVVPNSTLTKNQATGTYSITFTGSLVAYDQQFAISVGWECGSHHNEYPHGTVNFPYSLIKLDLGLSSLELSCNGSWKDSFPYQKRTPCVCGMDSDVSLDVAYDDVNFSCSFDTSVLPILDKEKVDISFPEVSFQPTIKAEPTSYSFLGINWQNVSQSVADSAKTELNKKLSGWKIELGDLSLFAVTNLLFPESKTIDPEQVFFPGDMVLIGKVTRQWTPPTKG